MSAPKPFIGGFFELDSPRHAEDGGLISFWDLPKQRNAAFVNARSAFAGLLKKLRVTRVFLPAYICPSMAAAVQTAGASLAYYPVGEALTPDVAFLEQNIARGDVVVGVNYFGRAPQEDFRQLAAKSEGIFFVEDCAQSMDTGLAPWGDYRLFSPRKLVGVADGGYIIPCSPKAQPISITTYAANDDSDLTFAPMLRAQDKEGEKNKQWHDANQAKEAKMRADFRQITDISWRILGSYDVSAAMIRRAKNYKTLAKALGDIAFEKAPVPPYCPFGFVVRLPDDKRDAFVEYLIANNIFPAVHWRDLPSPAQSFQAEHQLSKELLTLPCDQRYDEADMNRIIDTIKALQASL